MELVVFFFAFTVSVLLTVKKDKPSSLIFIFYLIFGFILSYVIRTSGYDHDINRYADNMSSDIVSLYYLREPFLWFGMRWGYEFFGNTLVVFIVLDLVCFLLLYRVFLIIGLPAYAYFLMFIYLPFFVGFENVLRQFVASIFLLFSIYLIGKTRYGFFIASALTHNIAVLFAPLVFRIRLKGLIELLPLFLLVTTAMLYFSNRKVEINTGIDFGTLFFIFILIFTIILRLRIVPKNRYFFDILYFAITIMLAANLTLSSGQTERIGYLLLCIMFPIIILFIEKVRPQIIARMITCVIFFIFLIIFNMFNNFISFNFI